MSRKQNSLMRFSRTERLAQLSEQEIVIEKKKREIQAKLEAQKKKEKEEAFKKLEFSKESKNAKPGFSKKSWSGSESKISSDGYKPVEKVQESLTNAFSNDGTFLDQFKKLSQSGPLSNFELPTIAAEKRDEGDSKNFLNPSEESFSAGEINRKRENEDVRDNSDSFEKSKRTWNNNQFSFIRNSSDSRVQLQTSRVFQNSQLTQGVPVLPAGDKSKPTAHLLPVQMSQAHCGAQHPEFHLDNIPWNSNQSNYSNTIQSKKPELCQSFNLKEFSANKSNCNSFSSTSIQPPVTSQNILGPSPKLPPSLPTKELPKVRSESISMTLKANTVKKLEAIPNPLEIDQELSPDPQTKNRFRFPEKESSKNTFSNASQNCRSGPILGNLSSFDKKSSRISSAFWNEDDDNDGDDEEDVNEGGGRSNDKLQHWASLVARCGDEFENSLRSRNENDPDLKFLSDKNSKEYMSFRSLVLKCRMRLKCGKEPSEKCRKLNSPKTYNEGSMENMFSGDQELHESKTDLIDSEKISDSLKEANKFSKIHEDNIISDECNNVSDSTLKAHCFSHDQIQSLSKETSSQVLIEENNGEGCDQLKTEERRKRKRKSRWGDAEPTISISGNEKNLDLQPPGKLPAPNSTLLTQLTRSDPGLIQYARQTFGSTNLSEEDWKKAEDHYKINLLYQDMIKKRAEVEKLERQGKFKYEYDSDEDTEGGTWEHKLRQQEMQATQLWAEELTRQAAGKHHIGDFLPPEELERFMEKYNAVKEGREPDLSDYKEYKLKEDNVGYRLLQKMGWNEGQGLGQDGSGITNPVNKGATRHENQGLGVERPDGLEPGDDEYDAYRKRMMLAYRFRPNPLNNPRRPYY